MTFSLNVLLPSFSRFNRALFCAAFVSSNSGLVRYFINGGRRTRPTNPGTTAPNAHIPQVNSTLKTIFADSARTGFAAIPVRNIAAVMRLA